VSIKTDTLNRNFISSPNLKIYKKTATKNFECQSKK
jgi:hypothetical protein